MKLALFFSIILSFSINYSVFAQTQLEIWEIQGDGNISPYNGDLVQANNNVVTAVGSDRFYLQTPDNRADLDVKTSNGIVVYTSGTPTVQLGDLINVVGTVREFGSVTEFSSTGLQITTVSSGTTLPTAAILDQDFPNGLIQNVPDLESVEGMLVEFFDAIVTEPSGSNGKSTLTTRPIRSFREAGIKHPGTEGLPIWDGNPEVFSFNPDALGINGGEELSAGMAIDAVGVIDFDDGQYEFFPRVFNITGNPAQNAVRPRANQEVTIGSLNVLLLFADEPEYLIRLTKIARYITELMGSPDIIAIQEAQSLLVMNDIADKVKQMFPHINYRAFLKTGNGGGSFSINTGFLVRESVQNIVIDQVGKNETLSIGGSLFTRPPLILEGEFVTDPPTPITVMNLHLRSLGGIEGGDSFFVRTKRHEQALFVANRVQNMQDDNLVVIGDFNAFQFSDGYVDVVNQIAGTPSLGAQFNVQNIVSPPLTNQSLTVAEEERYSFTFDGNSQILDHCLTNELTDIQINGLQYARGNADNPDLFVENPNVIFHASDHDGLVLFLELNNSLLVANNNLSANDKIQVDYPNPFSSNGFIKINLATADFVDLKIYGINGSLLMEKNLGYLTKGEHVFNPELALTDGFYILQLKGKDFSYSSKLVYVK